MRGRILIIRGGAIGDFILTLPVLAALRRQFPAASLEVLGYPQVVALAAAGGLADGVRPIESRPLAGFFARRGALDPALAEEFAGIHVVVSYLFDPDEIFRDNLAKVTKAQIIQGPHRPDGSRPIHATDQLLEPLQRLAIFGADPVPRIRLAAAAPSQRPSPGSGASAPMPPRGTSWRSPRSSCAASGTWACRCSTSAPSPGMTSPCSVSPRAPAPPNTQRRPAGPGTQAWNSR
ncbi:MAG: hypothetical protein WCP53_06980 [Verrucomicrobiota bacterium]